MTEVATLESFFSASNPVVDPLWNDLSDMIKNRYRNTPRHLQKELGPSEVGHPCMRRVAYGMMQVPRCNPEYDPLPSIFGTAMHTWLEGAAQMDNERLGWRRWLTEVRVEVVPGLTGSCDLYDRQTDTVIDWKTLGYTSFTAHVKNVSPTYKAQGQFYGRGFKNLGFQPKRVAISALPRTGTMKKMDLQFEDYDDELVDLLLAKRTAIIGLIDDFDVDEHPDRYHWIPATPYDCYWCPWWAPKASPDNGLQCPGGTKKAS